MKKFVAALVLGIAFFSFSYSAEESCLSTTDVSVEEVQQKLSKVLGSAKVVSVSDAPIEGFYEVVVDLRGRWVPIYVDCDFKYVISGEIIDVEKRTSITRERVLELSKKSIEEKMKELSSVIGKKKAEELKKIGEAFIQKAKIVDIKELPEPHIVLGNPDAKIKLYIVEDPECPACAMYHTVIEDVLKERKDIAFNVLLFPLPIHKHAKKISYNILCQKDMKKRAEILSKSFEYVNQRKMSKLKELEKDCKGAQEKIDRVVNFFRKNAPIGGTPTTIFPLKNGKALMRAGVIDKDTLLKIVDVLYK